MLASVKKVCVERESIMKILCEESVFFVTAPNLFADVIFVKRKPKLFCKKDRLPEESLPAPLDGFAVLFILIV